MNKNDFEKNIINSLAAISHEMNTPINLITSTAKLASLKIDRDYDTQSIKQYMNNIVNNCNKISMLISNIMDIELAPLSIKKFVDAKQFFDGFLENITPYCTEYNVEIESKYSAKREFIDIYVNTVERILLNLITNAIKYNDKKNKKIKISMTVNEDNIVLCVKDNGMGISKDNLDKVTDKFFRENKDVPNGLGIGLSLVKKYMENMQGEMTIKSQQKKGTEVILNIPITPEDRIFTAGECNYIYNPETSNFDIEFAQLKNIY